MLKRHCSDVCLVYRLLLMVLMFSFATVGCGGGGGGGGGGSNTTYTINAIGGSGGAAGGIGAFGGIVRISKNGGSAPVEVLTSGSVDAGFSPTNATPDLGANPLHITTDTTILVATVGPAQDTPYLITSDDSLRISDGDAIIGDEPPVTGLSVASGATLTLALNSGLPPDEADIEFSNDVVNNGTITTQDVDALLRGALELDFANFISSPGSHIDTSGNLPSQRGGDIDLATGIGGTAFIYNQGSIDGSGADNTGGVGGSSANITLSGFTLLENRGTITCSGGAGGAGFGGAAGIVTLESGVGDLFNSGAIHARGGDGDTNAGPGGLVELNSAVFSSSGEIRNTGHIDVSGGNSTGGNGGFAGAITLDANGDDLTNSGHLTATGGSTSDPAADGSGGGFINLISSPQASPLTPAGNVQVAGDIDCSGGHASATGSGNGGSAGSIAIQIDASGKISGINGLPAPTTHPLSLLGYSRINATGGSGNIGGNGGTVFLFNLGERWSSGSTFVDDPSGDVINESALTVSGGSVATGATLFPAAGGFGGSASLRGDMEIAETNPAAERIINSGHINASGGNSMAMPSGPGPNGGTINFHTLNTITNSGTLTCNGGNDSVDDNSIATGFGYDAGMVVLLSPQSTTNSGAISASGGNGEAGGGIGGGIVLANIQVINSANLRALGGNADTTLIGSTGGNGGQIDLDDIDVPEQTGTLNVSGGAGALPGTDGTITP